MSLQRRAPTATSLQSCERWAAAAGVLPRLQSCPHRPLGRHDPRRPHHCTARLSSSSYHSQRPRTGLHPQSRRPGQDDIWGSSPRPGLLCVEGRRHHASLQDGKRPQRRVAVVGGGVTGLASAYFLAEALPGVHVTVFEQGPRVGGWMHSKRMDVGDGEVIFESGPRSLRPAPPNGTLALRLAQELDLAEDLLVTSRRSPAARNRFVYYPDRLVRMPGPGESIFSNLRTLLFEPVFQGLFQGLRNEIVTMPRDASVEDESVGDFIARRFRRSLADNLASALFHGIYAGDIWRLSARSLLALPWAREARHGDLASAAVMALMKKQHWVFCDEVEAQELLQTERWDARIAAGMTDCSVFTFKHGLGQFAESLERSLRQRDNVTIMTDTHIAAIEQKQTSSDLTITHVDASSGNAVKPSSTTLSTFTHLISTIAPKSLIPLFTASSQQHTNALKRSIGATEAVTVLVVNLYYRTPDLLLKVTPPGGLPRTSNGLRGFGYLIPQSVPLSQNPERALGVIFDSDISPALWTSVPADRLGTRLTVMLGGHWWDGWATYPDEDEARSMATAVLARHLGITEEPAAVVSTLQKDCIPQYTVGHHRRMGDGHDALLAAFDGRVRVAGSWYGGVGVNDCLRGAFDVVKGLVHDLPAEATALGGAASPTTASPSSDDHHPSDPRLSLGAAVARGALRRDGTVARGERTGLEAFARSRPMAHVRRPRPGELEVLGADPAAAEMGYFEGKTRVRRGDDE